MEACLTLILGGYRLEPGATSLILVKVVCFPLDLRFVDRGFGSYFRIWFRLQAMPFYFLLDIRMKYIAR